MKLLVPAPAERLAVLRILAGVFSLGYLAVRLPVFLALTDASPSRFDPVGGLAWLDAPLTHGVVVALVVGTLVAGVGFTAGAWFRFTGPAYALLLLVVTTYRSSWGQLLYFENLMVLHVLIVGFTRSADALSLDARRRPQHHDPDVAYGWPVRLAAAVTAVTYVLAAVAKLRIGGLTWMAGDTLRNHVAYSAARLELLGGTPSPIAGPLVVHGWLFPPLAVATVVIELAAPLALLGGRVRDTWVVLVWLLHAGVAALMFVVFPYPLFLLAFAPLYPLERLRMSRNSISPSSPTVAGPPEGLEIP
jgi:hypothetical protein